MTPLLPPAIFSPSSTIRTKKAEIMSHDVTCRLNGTSFLLFAHRFYYYKRAFYPSTRLDLTATMGLFSPVGPRARCLRGHHPMPLGTPATSLPCRRRKWGEVRDGDKTPLAKKQHKTMTAGKSLQIDALETPHRVDDPRKETTP